MLSSWSSNSYKQVWTHAIFWIAYFLYEWLNTGAYLDNFDWTFRFISMHLPLIMLAAYWHLLIGVRHFLLAGKKTGFWLSLIGGLVFFGIARRAINYFLFYPTFFPKALNKPFWYLPKILAETTHLHVVVALFVSIELARHTLQQQRLNEQYRQEKLSAEYRLLQSQVQPHFLFNTLNNLISVSMHRPEQMPNLLHRLAGLLSYQLNESHRDNVPLSKEIDYLKDYIALEKIRYGDRLDVQTNFDSLTSTSSLMIPPMLLLTLVENSFKHGAAQIDGASWIRIHLSMENSRLIFSVENSIPDESTPSYSGSGLANLAKRLEIRFSKDHELITMPEDGQFLAVLKFKID